MSYTKKIPFKEGGGYWIETEHGSVPVWEGAALAVEFDPCERCGRKHEQEKLWQCSDCGAICCVAQVLNNRDSEGIVFKITHMRLVRGRMYACGPMQVWRVLTMHDQLDSGGSA